MQDGWPRRGRKPGGDVILSNVVAPRRAHDDGDGLAAFATQHDGGGDGCGGSGGDGHGGSDDGCGVAGDGRTVAGDGHGDGRDA